MKDVTDLHAEFDGERLPPGQRETSRFPVLSKGGTPSVPGRPTLEVWGAVDSELTLSVDDLESLGAPHLEGGLVGHRGGTALREHREPGGLPLARRETLAVELGVEVRHVLHTRRWRPRARRPVVTKPGPIPTAGETCLNGSRKILFVTGG